MLYLQVIMQMQTHLTEKAGSSNILSKPEHILSFVRHALTSVTTQHSINEGAQHEAADSLMIKDLRIVPEKDSLSGGDDSDDEDTHTSGISIEDEMTSTAVDLLLAVLEGMVAY
jgi:hypothetical protein